MAMQTAEPGASLVAANGSTIQTFRKHTMHHTTFCNETVQVGLRHS